MLENDLQDGRDSPGTMLQWTTVLLMLPEHALRSLMKPRAFVSIDSNSEPHVLCAQDYPRIVAQNARVRSRIPMDTPESQYFSVGKSKKTNPNTGRWTPVPNRPRASQKIGSLLAGSLLAGSLLAIEPDPKTWIRHTERHTFGPGRIPHQLRIDLEQEFNRGFDGTLGRASRIVKLQLLNHRTTRR
jgi:hypothetical protein